MLKYKTTRLENQLDFTHPYLTISQMEKLIIRNYSVPRDFHGYSVTSEEMIADLHNQLSSAGVGGYKSSDLRMPVLVFPMPTDNMWSPVSYGFIVKLEANGETLVLTPIDN